MWVFPFLLLSFFLLVPLLFLSETSATSTSGSRSRSRFRSRSILNSVSQFESSFASASASLSKSNFSACSASSFSPSEYTALQQFYNSTGGEQWRWTTRRSLNATNNGFVDNGVPWNFSQPLPVNPCMQDWQGLECDLACEHIVAVFLVDHQIVGELPSAGALCELPSLLSIDLSLNRNITGTLPSCLGANLNYLENLQLDGCQLTGTVPSTLIQLTKLKNILLANNSLSGELPPFLPSLLSVERILIAGNLFTGTIWSNINHLTHLRVLDISDNLLHGTIPASLIDLRNLTELVISRSQISGSIPDGFHDIVSLQFFNVFDNFLEGYIKDVWLQYFSKMKQYDIGTNMFTGTIPLNISLWQELMYLNMDNNAFSGVIPRSLANISNLNELDLNHNMLTGTLPSVLSLISSLEAFDVGNNMLHGTLPAEYGNFLSLSLLFLNGNNFHGTIPSSYAALTGLNSFDVHFNDMSGTIPSFFGNEIEKLFHFEIDYNQFTGTVPANLTVSPFLYTLYLGSNLLTGTIPAFTSNSSTYLRSLDFSYNFFEGTIPNQIFQFLPQLVLVDVEMNLLTGPFPNVSALEATAITEIYMNENELDGSISEEVGGAFRALRNFDVHLNMFSGFIPGLLWTSCTKLNYLYLYGNFFDGVISSAMSYLPFLTELRLDDNVLSGQFPLVPNNLWSQVTIVNISYNVFTGTISSGFALLTELQIVDLSNNEFEGEIGALFAASAELEQIFLQQNSIRGNLDKLVNSTIQRFLSIIDVSGNQIQGSLPPEVFQLPNISIFSASKNCFTGSLPDNICDAQNLLILGLDGLNTAESCQLRMFPGSSLLTAYILANPLKGHIPSCLFNSMKNLQTLHLSGNGITGDLAGIAGEWSDNFTNYGLTGSLNDLSLSYNRLTGTIPTVLTSLPLSLNPWTNLDLSFNKFTGTLDEDMWSFYNASLRLDINRLSGNVPKPVLDAQNINILDGNMFSCSNERNKLPRQDPNYNSYVCGSDSVDRSLYAWIAFTGGTVLILIVIGALARCTGHEIEKPNSSRLSVFVNDSATRVQKLSQYIDHAVGYWNLTMIENFKEINGDIIQVSNQIRIFGNCMAHTRSWARRLTVIIVIVVIPVCIISTSQTPVYTFNYAWIISMAYLGGEIAALECLAIFVALLTGLYSKHLSWVSLNFSFIDNKCCEVEGQEKFDRNATNRAILVRSNSLKSGEIVDEDQGSYSPTLFYVVLAALALFDVSLVLVINMTYVYYMTTHLSTDLKQLLSFALAMYKFLWNTAAMEAFQDFVAGFLPPTLKNGRHEAMLGFMIKFFMWLALFNNIIAPVLSVAVMSSDCFYYALIDKPSPITSKFSVTSCNDKHFSVASLSEVCTVTTTTTYSTSYDPPFVYSYQCSSTVLVNFADIYVYRYLLGGVIAPAIEILIKILQEYFHEKYGAQDWRVFVCTSLVQPMLRPTTNHDNNKVRVSAAGSTTSLSVSDAQEKRTSSKSSDLVAMRITAAFRSPGEEPPDVVLRPTTSTKSISTNHDSERASLMLPAQSQFPLFKAKNYVIVLVSDIAILLVFGLVFPPLAIIGCITVFIRTITTQVILGRFIFLAHEQPYLVPYLKQINEECKGIRSLMMRTFQTLSVLLSVIWGCFAFDMLGDFKGLWGALWIFFVVAGWSFAIRMIDWCIDMMWPLYSFFMQKNEIKSIEMTSGPSQHTADSVDGFTTSNPIRLSSVA